MTYHTPEQYEKHREYNKLTRREKRAIAHKIRLAQEGKCLLCEIILRKDPEYPLHSCGNPYRR